MIDVKFLRDLHSELEEWDDEESSKGEMEWSIKAYSKKSMSI